MTLLNHRLRAMDDRFGDTTAIAERFSPSCFNVGREISICSASSKWAVATGSDVGIPKLASADLKAELMLDMAAAALEMATIIVVVATACSSRHPMQLKMRRQTIIPVYPAANPRDLHHSA